MCIRDSFKYSSIKSSAEIVNSFSILVNQIDGLDGNSLQSAALNLTSHLGNKAIVILGGIPNPENRRLLFVVSLGDEAVKIGLHAGKIINEIARICSGGGGGKANFCLLYTSPSPRDRTRSRMPSSA